MRALLVVNPTATATTQRVRDVLVNALAAELSVDVAQTKGRGHAVELAERAADTGLDLVISLGGDGTANEIVNGILRGGPRPDAPAVAFVPGGSTNVLARALGFPASAVEATGFLLETLREGRGRRIGLGLASFADRSRYFTFCAGYGVDASVVEQVEHKRGKGRRNTAGLYLRSAVGQFSRAVAHSAPTIGVTTGSPDNDPLTDVVRNAIVCNTTPWTYLNARGVRACPEASFDTGLDLLALRKLRASTALRTTTQMLREDGEPHGRNILSLHDEDSLTLRADRELAFQVDGEYLGRFTEVRLTAVPAAVRVLA